MKNKIKKFGAFLMALMLIITSVGNLSSVKAAGFDPDNLYWEFPIRSQVETFEFDAFKKPITVEAEKRKINMPMSGFEELDKAFSLNNSNSILLVKFKIYNEQAGDRMVYFPIYYNEKASSSSSIDIVVFYGDKIDISFEKKDIKYNYGQEEDIFDYEYEMRNGKKMNETEVSIGKKCIVSVDGYLNFPAYPMEIVGRGFKFNNKSNLEQTKQQYDISCVVDNGEYMIFERVKRDTPIYLFKLSGCDHNLISTTSKNITIDGYDNNGQKLFNTLLSPGNTYDINSKNYVNKIVVDGKSNGFNGEIKEAKKNFPDEEPSEDEKTKEEELAKAKEEAKKEIDKLENLSEEDKNKAKTDIDNAPDTTTVDKIVEDAKKKDADNKAASDEKAKEEELAKAKEEAKAEIDKLENLTDEQADKAKTDIDNAEDIPTIDKIVEDAKKKDADNKAASDEKAKEEELAKAKEEAKKEIDKLENLSEEDKDKAKSDIDNAPDTTTVDKIVEDAKKKDADNKTAADEKAKEEELAKAKEDAKSEIDKLPGLTNTDKDKFAKEIDSAKTVKEVKDIIDEAKNKSEAKLNENDPEYLKNKLKGLIEEAKRVRYPSEELEEAIDEAYDILLDRYSRVEDYKYAIENLERILQNMRDTRRNRFKLDVDDLNEKDEELTGKTETKWYIDVYNGKKRILSGQANYKGDFAIEIKKGKIKAKDTLKVVATDPQNDKKYKEVEIEVGGDSKETKDNKPTFNINDLLQADGSKPLTDLAVFPVGKNFYNVVQNGQKTTVYMDVKTFISGNRTMLPIRYIAYTLGFNVEYDNFTREAIFSNTENSALAKKTIRVNIDTGLMKDSYGNVFASDVRPVLINNRIHASIANIARMFEASQGTIEDGINQTIEWDSARKAVYVFKNIK